MKNYLLLGLPIVGLLTFSCKKDSLMTKVAFMMERTLI